MSQLIFPYTKLRICLSFKCNFSCDYCSIRHFQEDLYKGDEYKKEERSAEEWIGRLKEVRFTKPMSIFIFGAGESTLVEGFADIINAVKDIGETHIYTNGSTAARKVFENVIPRDSLGLYVSYHPFGIDMDEFAENAKWMLGRFRVFNFHTPNAPSVKDLIPEHARRLKEKGITLVTDHPYLVQRPGEYAFYDEIGELVKFKNRFRSRVEGVPLKTVYCKMSMNHALRCNIMSYPIAPNGDIYICWRYLFNHSKEGVLGNIFNKSFAFNDNYFECNYYGDCNMCAWDRNIIDKETGRQLDTDVIDWRRIG